MSKVLNKATYAGKGRPKLSDYMEERDYSRELINSTERAELGSYDDEDDSFLGVLMVVGVALVLIVGSMILTSIY